jgi:hypothetical protein
MGGWNAPLGSALLSSDSLCSPGYTDTSNGDLGSWNLDSGSQIPDWKPWTSDLASTGMLGPGS